MHVAFVSLFTPHHGVTPPRARTRRIATSLAGRGHNVTWLCSQWWGGDHDSFEEDGIVYRRVTVEPEPTAFATRLPTRLWRTAPDVVHAVNSPPGAAIAATFSRGVHRAPVLVDWWCDRPEDSGLRYRWLSRRPDAIVTPSETVRTRVREHGGAPDAIRVIHNGVDFDLVETAPIDDRFDIVYARRLDRHANVESFLLGLAELRDRDWRAAVIGDGPERTAAQRTAADLRIADRVSFLGDTGLEDRVSLLKGSHVVAQTATREVFATDLLWALACGCVALVEYQAGSSAHELVEGRERASLVTSPQELASAFVEAGALPHRTVADDVADHDHPAILERYLSVYRELLSERGAL